MSRLNLTAAIVGAALIVTGVSFIFWPAGLIVAGVILVTAGLTDFKE